MKSQNRASPDHSNQLVRSLFATLADDAQWPAVMEAICCEFEACGTALATHDFAKGHGKILFHCPHFLEPMIRHQDLFYGDPLLTSGTHFHAGSVVLGAEVAQSAGLLRTKGIYHRLFGVLERKGTIAEFLYLGRSRSKPPFSAEERRRLPQLLVHLGEVRDLGRSLNAKLFERHAFITGVKHGYVAFDYQARNGDLVRNRVTPDDVRWASRLLGRLTPAQWNDALVAAGALSGAARAIVPRMAVS